MRIGFVGDAHPTRRRMYFSKIYGYRLGDAVSLLAFHKVGGDGVSPVVNGYPKGVKAFEVARCNQGQVGISTIISRVFDQHSERFEVPYLRCEKSRGPFCKVMSFHAVAPVGVGTTRQ